MKELLFSLTKKDFIIEWYSGTGAGGQHRNKHQNCCRIKHQESGAEATGTETRSRDDNQKSAFKRLVNSEKFQKWLKIKASEELLTKAEKEQHQKEIERWVEKQMDPKNLKIEYL
jgi:protein subunit release factor B